MVQILEKPATTGTDDQPLSPAPVNRTPKIFNPETRDRLIAYRDENKLSLADLARELNSNPASLSKYFNGKPEGDVRKFEALAEDILKTAGSRMEVKAANFPTNVTKRVAAICEQIRKTDDFGLIHGPAGIGKTLGKDMYAAINPTAIAIELNRWQSSSGGIVELLFQSMDTRSYSGNVRRISWMVQRLSKSRRLIIIDNAQRITSGGLQMVFDFHDATGCPIVLQGNPEVLEKIRKNDQQFSRIGIVREVKLEGHDEVAAELIAQILPECAKDRDLHALAVKVVENRGHLRALRKQLVLTRELMEAKAFAGQPAKAFKGAHTQLVRDYKLLEDAQ